MSKSTKVVTPINVTNGTVSVKANEVKTPKAKSPRELARDVYYADNGASINDKGEKIGSKGFDLGRSITDSVKLTKKGEWIVNYLWGLRCEKAEEQKQFCIGFKTLKRDFQKWEGKIYGVSEVITESDVKNAARGLWNEVRLGHRSWKDGSKWMLKMEMNSDGAQLITWAEWQKDYFEVKESTKEETKESAETSESTNNSVSLSAVATPNLKADLEDLIRSRGYSLEEIAKLQNFIKGLN